VLWGASWFPTWPSCRGTHRAGGYHQCVVRVRERSAAEAGSAPALLMISLCSNPPGEKKEKKSGKFVLRASRERTEAQ
jgi:hypothetical protein